MDKVKRIKAIEIRETILGHGRAEPCLPLMSSCPVFLEKEIKWALSEGISVFEYRGDLTGETGVDIIDSLKHLRELIGEKVLIYTYRSLEEGGQGDLSPEDYLEHNLEILAFAPIDILDVELEKGPDVIRKLIEEVENLNEKVGKGQKHIQLSRHFLKEAIKQELALDSFLTMQEYPISMTKVVVTAGHEKEALELMELALDMRDKYADRPFTAIAMGEKGIISRLTSSFTGSALNFVKGQTASAPGQLDVKIINKIEQLNYKGS